MTSTLAPSRKSSRSKSRKTPPVPKPATPYPGYMTDEWFLYLQDSISRMTPDEVQAHLLKAGITDTNGQLTAPYRS